MQTSPITAAVTLTQAELAAAFELWETRYRDNPADFLTQEETSAMVIASVSEACAIYFTALAREVRGSATPLAYAVTHEAEGFSLTLTCQVSCLALQRELEAVLPPGLDACIPVSDHSATLDRLTKEALPMLREAHPRLLTCLVAAAYDHQSKLNELAIVAQGGAA